MKNRKKFFIILIFIILILIALLLSIFIINKIVQKENFDNYFLDFVYINDEPVWNINKFTL